MDIKNVMIAGCGTLGSQIGWQTAFHGFQVTVFSNSEKGSENCKALHQNYADLFKNTRGATQEQIDAALKRLHYTTDLNEAVKDADIVSESVPENPEIKRGFYQKLSAAAPEKTIFTSNSSTMVPSEIAGATDRPEKFLALHFANGIWDANIGEIMGHPGTDPKYLAIVEQFAKDIGMVPIPIHKEQHGYIINSLLVPLLKVSLNLVVDDISDFKSIDKTWMISTGMRFGPFGIMDMIGLETIYNIELLSRERDGDTTAQTRADYLEQNYISKGKLGMKTNEGFYTYPDPEYQVPDFLT
jgi:3-hydroxybutyryl-CoA dehydrogenase